MYIQNSAIFFNRNNFHKFFKFMRFLLQNNFSHNQISYIHTKSEESKQRKKEFSNNQVLLYCIAWPINSPLDTQNRQYYIHVHVGKFPLDHSNSSHGSYKGNYHLCKTPPIVSIQITTKSSKHTRSDWKETESTHPLPSSISTISDSVVGESTPPPAPPPLTINTYQRVRENGECP